MTVRKYGRLPQAIYPYLPDACDALKKYTGVSPYKVIGDMFGVSKQRVQQVVIAERKRQAKEAARAITDSERT